MELWNIMPVGCRVMIAALEMRMLIEMVLQAVASEWLVQVLCLFMTKQWLSGTRMSYLGF